LQTLSPVQMPAQTSIQSWRPVAPTALILIVTSPGCFNSCPLQRPSMNTTCCFPGRCQFTSADHTFLLHRLRRTGTQAQRGVVDGSHTFHNTSSDASVGEVPIGYAHGIESVVTIFYRVKFSFLYMIISFTTYKETLWSDR